MIGGSFLTCVGARGLLSFYKKHPHRLRCLSSRAVPLFSRRSCVNPSVPRRLRWQQFPEFVAASGSNTPIAQSNVSRRLFHRWRQRPTGGDLYLQRRHKQKRHHQRDLEHRTGRGGHGLKFRDADCECRWLGYCDGGLQFTEREPASFCFPWAGDLRNEWFFLAERQYAGHGICHRADRTSPRAQ